MFTCVRAPTRRRSSSPDIWKCGGDQNYMSYCNRQASTLMNKASVNLDDAAAAKLLNQAETLMVKDIPSIPMFARPVFAIRNKK